MFGAVPTGAVWCIRDANIVFLRPRGSASSRRGPMRSVTVFAVSPRGPMRPAWHVSCNGHRRVQVSTIVTLHPHPSAARQFNAFLRAGLCRKSKGGSLSRGRGHAASEGSFSQADGRARKGSRCQERRCAGQGALQPADNRPDQGSRSVSASTVCARGSARADLRRAVAGTGSRVQTAGA